MLAVAAVRCRPESAHAVVIAIDGPAGAGKSTVARALAKELGYRYLDSGAMYRCVALLTLADPRRSPAELAEAARIEMAPPVVTGPAECAEGGSGAIRLDGRDVSDLIRTPAVSEQASVVAADPAVRAALVAKQRDLLAGGDWVAEGRDIGSVVAPGAELKVYLDADPAERARRRAAELGADPAGVLAEQTLRDERDRQREASPLRAAEGAIALDTTGLEAEQVVAQIAALARERTARGD